MSRRSSSCSMPRLQASGAGLWPPCTAPQKTGTFLAAAEKTWQTSMPALAGQTAHGQH